jgi:ubiquinone/menaquinone biosynthesis C-methylase UbiE
MSGRSGDAVQARGILAVQKPNGMSGVRARVELPAENSAQSPPDSTPQGASVEGGDSAGRVSRVADQRAEAWSTCTQNYDVFAEAVTRPFAEDAVKLVRFAAGAQVLDVAAGTGSFALAAARRGAHVLATDFAPAMLAQLAEKSRAEGLLSVRTAVMDGQALQVESESFDVAGSLFGLMFFPNYDQGLRELLRVLKPGGQAVIGVWAAPARVELMRLLGEAAMAAMIEVPHSSGQPLWAPLSDAAQLPNRLRRLGFARAHVVVVRHMWAFEAAEYLAELLPTMTPAYAELVQLMDPQQRVVFCNALADGLRERQGDGPFALTTEGLIAVGTKARS